MQIHFFGIGCFNIFLHICTHSWIGAVSKYNKKTLFYMLLLNNIFVCWQLQLWGKCASGLAKSQKSCINLWFKTFQCVVVQESKWAHFQAPIGSSSSLVEVKESRTRQNTSSKALKHSWIRIHSRINTFRPLMTSELGHASPQKSFSCKSLHYFFQQENVLITEAPWQR